MADSRAAAQERTDTAQGGGHDMTPAQLHHHEMRFLKALKLLVDSGKAKTVDDLLRAKDRQRRIHVQREVLPAGPPPA